MTSPARRQRFHHVVWFLGGTIAITVLGVVWQAARQHGGLRELARKAYRRTRSTFKLDPNPLATVDPLTLPGEHPASTTVTLSIDPRPQHRISPLIYGMAFAPPAYLSDLRLGLNRWGGNDKTRYNWVQGNACNAARDWLFANRPATTTPLPTHSPSMAADRFVLDNRSQNVPTLLTVPTIGWVARDADTANRSRDVPTQGGDPLADGAKTGAIAGYDPTQNRARTSVPSYPRKGKPFTLSPAPSPIYQDEWVYHLTRTLGPAKQNGVRFFAMDNEPDLWDATHTDVHPARAGYDELLSRFLDYATAVKAVDPSAQITGPVSWGWVGYQYSPLDRGSDNFRTHADRARHGDQPFLQWFLRQVAQADRVRGSRSLDVLDVHYYPQSPGLYPGREKTPDAATQARRIRATRSLWDPTYPDESWIQQPIRLLPLLQEWIATGYPGTQIGITEWNWGGEQDISGGLAIAETLGLFGRENVYLANYWAFPSKDSPAYLAFKLYRNADGQGHGFGDQACAVTSDAPQQVSCFAAHDAASGALTLVLINKMPQTAAKVHLRLAGGPNPLPLAQARAWRLSRAAPDRIQAVSGADALPLPPYSLTLIRLPNFPDAAPPMSRAAPRQKEVTRF